MAAGDHRDNDKPTITQRATVISRPRPVQDSPTVAGPNGARLAEQYSQATVRCEPPGKASGHMPRLSTAPVGGESRFEDQGQIAKGGMAAIRKVFDTVILRNAAMKVMTDGADDASSLSRFVEEAQITGQLDHPNIVPVYDIGVDEHGLPTRFTMKLVHGETLAAILDDNATDPDNHERLEVVLQAFVKICDAVSFAHSRGVIHRDLKPANVMIGSHGQVYLMDWGIALLLDGGERKSNAGSTGDNGADAGVRTGGNEASNELPGTLSGTPAYMAPEQAFGRTHEMDERTDVFGLGAMLYEIITFQPPYLGKLPGDEMDLARQARVTPPETLQPDRPLPPGLCRIAMKALSPARADRYETVDALKHDVVAFLRGGGWFATNTFAAGTEIVREGDDGHVAYIVQNGHCRVEKTINDERVVIGHMAAGDVFGETAIFSASPRTATVIAEDDVTALVVTKEALDRELARNAWLGSFVRALARRFVDVDRQLTALGRGNR